MFTNIFKSPTPYAPVGKTPSKQKASTQAKTALRKSGGVFATAGATVGSAALHGALSASMLAAAGTTLGMAIPAIVLLYAARRLLTKSDAKLRKSQIEAELGSLLTDSGALTQVLDSKEIWEPDAGMGALKHEDLEALASYKEELRHTIASKTAQVVFFDTYIKNYEKLAQQKTSMFSGLLGKSSSRAQPTPEDAQRQAFYTGDHSEATYGEQRHHLWNHMNVPDTSVVPVLPVVTDNPSSTPDHLPPHVLG